MKYLDILVGPMASGKSTYCNQEAKNDAIIVCDDDITNMVHGSNYSLYTTELIPLYKAIENNIIQMGLALNRHVIIDRPNYSIKMRRRYIGLAHSLDAWVTCRIFPDEGSSIQALRRFKRNPRGLSLQQWTEAAIRHADLYEVPGYNEGIDQIVIQ